MQKRYEYWASENGVPVKKFTQWFTCSTKSKEPWQMKNKLHNEYKDD